MLQDNSKNDPSPVNSLNRPHRHSLQHKRNEMLNTNFRHTKSDRYSSEEKKKIKRAIILTPLPATINESPETETDDNMSEKPKTEQITMENEKRISKTSKKSEKSMYVYDNTAYEGNLDKRSISSRAGSSRQPSIQSLEVVREQYCCCARRTKCEKRLILTVAVLSIVVVILIIVLALIAAHRDIDVVKSTFKQWTT